MADGTPALEYTRRRLRLTVRQFTVFCALLNHRVVSREHISKLIWGPMEMPRHAETIIANCIYALRRKGYKIYVVYKEGYALASDKRDEYKREFDSFVHAYERNYNSTVELKKEKY